MSKDIEIELKFPLLNGAVVESFLNKNADFQYESFQHDEYYNAPHRDFLANSDDINEWFRIRVTGGQAQITYKDYQPHGAKNKTHCKELEANVDSHDQLSQILGVLDFVRLVDVKKTRKAWNYKDTEVSLDSVEDLGDFIEVEYKGDLDDIDLARKHLFTVLEGLGAKTGELDTNGYPYLVMKKKGLWGKLD